MGHGTTTDEYYNYWGETQKTKKEVPMTQPSIDLNYRGDLEIDKFDLPGEWERQPTLYARWAEEWAYAVQTRDQAKDNLDLVKANVDSAIRKEPTEYGFTSKPTEAAILGCVVQQIDYEEAMEKLHQANLNVNLLAGAKAGFDHKKRALESLTTLMVNEFYQSSGVPSQATVAAGKKGQTKQKRNLGGK